MSDLWEPPGLRAIVEKTRFLMPGWRVSLLDWRDSKDGSGGLTLVITSRTIDSYNPEETVSINHPFLVPPATYNEPSWKAWIMERYCDVWRHEIGEMLEFDGVKEFAPHHGNHENPYITWHVGDLAATRVRAGKAQEDSVPEGWEPCDSFGSHPIGAHEQYVMDNA